MRIQDVRNCNPIQASRLNYNMSLPKVLQVATAIGRCGFKLLYNVPLSTTKHQQEIQELFLSLYGQPSMQQVTHEESSLSNILAHVTSSLRNINHISSNKKILQLEWCCRVAKLPVVTMSLQESSTTYNNMLTRRIFYMDSRAVEY